MTSTCVLRPKDYRLSMVVNPGSEVPYTFVAVDTDADHEILGFKVLYSASSGINLLFRISDGQGYEVSDEPVQASQYQTPWGNQAVPSYLFQASIIGAGQFARVLFPYLVINAGGQIRVAVSSPPVSGTFSNSAIKFVFHTVKRFHP